MTLDDLVAQIKYKKSFLCIGLDVDLDKVPMSILNTDDPIFEFNKAIIDATHDLAVAYKPNTAFYEAYGVKGWKALAKTIAYIDLNYPELFTIADAKRGDIGNTSGRYAAAFFNDMNFDSVTVAPYMGKDSVEPFLSFEDKYTILLALTSNQGAFDFQTENLSSSQQSLYTKVIEISRSWKNAERLMYVVGATKASELKSIRSLVPSSFLLVPGVGAQGGSLDEVCKNAFTEDCGLLVNSSRGIIYASSGIDYAVEARHKALELQQQMAVWVSKLE